VEVREMGTRVDRATYRFGSRDAAWAFMFSCDDAGLLAGYPGLVEYTVKVAIETNADRTRADGLAEKESGTVVAYEFEVVEMPNPLERGERVNRVAV